MSNCCNKTNALLQNFGQATSKATSKAIQTAPQLLPQSNNVTHIIKQTPHGPQRPQGPQSVLKFKRKN
jgi:hypothetical protein